MDRNDDFFTYVSAGLQAFLDGDDIHDNPHKAFTDEYRWWRIGWFEASEVNPDNEDTWIQQWKEQHGE